MKLKKKFNYIEGFEKIEIKRMRIKNKIQNKFYIKINGEIEKQN
jgi:hypothetical protein